MAEAKTRYYFVAELGEDREQAPIQRLIEASSPSQALRHVAGKRFLVRVAEPTDVMNVMRDQGDKAVEKAASE
jgi:hypothetical protein